jgi:centromere protein S
MPGLRADEDEKEQKLKAALWYSVGQIVDAVTMSQGLHTTPHFVGGLSELCWAQIENATRDMETFARHAGRGTINSSDVVLLGRRNEGLEAILVQEIKAVKERNVR